ncbi:hypothetical protein [Actinoplanes sp. RD1]|uniref:hypothetical protein n=1 Tax=Actinoplanes sp. RD1 TaxID=3064538 RepID=UPI0027424749|nr:hypothetical protein [Actinoplanes sp. RD1]
MTTRYIWIPHGGSGGWLLVHRSIAGTVPGGDGGRSSEEFWVTGEIAPEDATDVLRESGDAWRPMVLGEPVNFLLWPYVLTAVTGRQLRRVREQVLLTPIRPLADIRVQVTETPDGPVVAAPALVTVADDPYAPRTADLALDDGWETGGLDPARRREVLLAALDRRVELPVASPACVVHINRFVGSHDEPPLDRRGVRAAVAAVLADPADPGPRERLVDELAGHGWSCTAEPLVLRGMPKPAFLDRIALFLTREGDRAAYRIVAPPAVAEVIAQDEELATELAAFLAPLEPALRPSDVTFLELLPGMWDVPRERAMSLAPPAWDEVVALPEGGTVTVGKPPVLDIRHVELFDSQGLPSGTFDLSSIPMQTTGGSAMERSSGLDPRGRR